MAERTWPLPGQPTHIAGLAHWRLVRRCALTPGQLLLSYAAVLAVSGLTAMLFGWRGVWMVPLFCLLQAVLAGAMYLNYFIHAIDGEQITLRRGGTLAIEVVCGLRTRRYVLNPAWSRVERGGRFRDRLWLCCSQDRVEVGTQLRPGEKRRFERELKQALAAWRAGLPELSAPGL